ncbi:unnamed protein product [Prunus armeniaca]|uniref:Uncharacterized protein n=1 Tax=Prunus armeniaca TaxID=36596 RepID=A0A6J5VJD9_PRUAR|nr:unnamed protein product [Prunus armeniaca]
MAVLSFTPITASNSSPNAAARAAPSTVDATAQALLHFLLPKPTSPSEHLVALALLHLQPQSFQLSSIITFEFNHLFAALLSKSDVSFIGKIDRVTTTN